MWGEDEAHKSDYNVLTLRSRSLLLDEGDEAGKINAGMRIKWLFFALQHVGTNLFH